MVEFGPERWLMPINGGLGVPAWRDYTLPSGSEERRGGGGTELICLVLWVVPS